MSQRGGSVTTQVRYGDKVYSPIIGKGSADILVSFEKMEALRYLDELNQEGIVIINDYKKPTATTLSGSEEYPDDIIDYIKTLANTKILNAAKIAEEMGNSKVMNIVLLGALVKMIRIEDLDWGGTMRENVKPAFLEINLKAFSAGISAVA
jgi:indolepyruvate ferredoxin oxidoreductase beta subunit